jgi:Zn-dependent peptidase ImmA (M78 family)
MYVKCEKPKNVNICGLLHEIIYEEDKFQIDDIKFGFIDYQNAKIYINSNVAEEVLVETLCHEIIHGILFHIGRQEMSDDEILVQALANAINQSFSVKELILPTLTISGDYINTNEQKQSRCNPGNDGQ